jgi:hypothetical protein
MVTGHLTCALLVEFVSGNIFNSSPLIGDFVVSLYFFDSCLSHSAQLMPKRLNILNINYYSYLYIQDNFFQTVRGGQIWSQIAKFGQ